MSRIQRLSGVLLANGKMASTNSAIPETPFVQTTAEGTCRVITLTRPRALHTLNLAMIDTMMAALRVWEASSCPAQTVLIRAAPIEGGRKVFCAGGDVVALVKSLSEPGGSHNPIQFLYNEYALNHYIGAYAKPIVAFIDGITSTPAHLYTVVGGGAGISVHAPFRVATEHTVFAMPETAIGYFPDVGGSFFLSRLEAPLGMYLGLTGARLHAQDVYHAGLATHYVSADAVPDIQRSLQNAVGPAAVSRMLDSFMAAEMGPLSIAPVMPAIRDCFGEDTLAGIVAKVGECVGSRDAAVAEWAAATMKALLAASPVALAVTFLMQRRGAALSFKACFRMEIGMVHKFTSNSITDFKEGVTAKLIQKTNRPRWVPASIQDIDWKLIEELFAEPRELAFVNGCDYMEYPHAEYALPTTRRILEAAGGVREGDPVEVLCRQWREKPGLRARLEQVLGKGSQ